MHRRILLRSRRRKRSGYDFIVVGGVGRGCIGKQVQCTYNITVYKILFRLFVSPQTD